MAQILLFLLVDVSSVCRAMAASVWTVSVLVALALLTGEACIVMQCSNIRMQSSKIILIKASPFMGLTSLLQDLAFGFRLFCLDACGAPLMAVCSGVTSGQPSKMRSLAGDLATAGRPERMLQQLVEPMGAGKTFGLVSRSALAAAFPTSSVHWLGSGSINTVPKRDFREGSMVPFQGNSNGGGAVCALQAAAKHTLHADIHDPLQASAGGKYAAMAQAEHPAARDNGGGDGGDSGDGSDSSSGGSGSSGSGATSASGSGSGSGTSASGGGLISR